MPTSPSGAQKTSILESLSHGRLRTAIVIECFDVAISIGIVLCMNFIPRNVSVVLVNCHEGGTFGSLLAIQQNNEWLVASEIERYNWNPLSTFHNTSIPGAGAHKTHKSVDPRYRTLQRSVFRNWQNRCVIDDISRQFGAGAYGFVPISSAGLL